MIIGLGGLFLAIVGILVALLGFLRDVTDYQVSLPESATDAVIYNFGTVQACQTVNLTGRAGPREDSELWLAYKKSGSTDLFLHQTQPLSGSQEWSSELYFETDTDSNPVYEFYLFYLPNTYSQFLRGVKPRSLDGEPGYFVVENLPPDVEPTPVKTLVRVGPVQASC